MEKKSKGDESNSDESIYESLSEEEEEEIVSNGNNSLIKPKGAISVLKDAYLENYPDIPIRIPQEQV